MATAKKPAESFSGAADNPFSAAPAATSVKFPSIKQLGNGAELRTVVYAPGSDQEQSVKSRGRLCIFQPVKLERAVPSRFAGVPPSDRMSVDITVLDGEPISAVLDKDGDETYTFPEPLVPAFTLPSMFLSQKLVVDQLMAAYETKGMILGRLVLLPPKTSGGNKAWAIGAFTPDEAAIASAWVKANPAPELFD